jgi:hypothetical protein
VCPLSIQSNLEFDVCYTLLGTSDRTGGLHSVAGINKDVDTNLRTTVSVLDDGV